MIEFLKEINKKLDAALDAEETSDVESIDLLYEISEMIESKIEELEQ